MSQRMSTAAQISHIVKNPPSCQRCPEQKLVVTSQSMAISASGIDSTLNAGCGNCGGLFEVSLEGEILSEQH